MNSILTLQDEPPSPAAPTTFYPSFEKWKTWYEKFSANAEVSDEWLKLFEEGTELMIEGFEESLLGNPHAEFAFMICPFIQTVVGDRRPRWNDHVGYEAIMENLKKFFLGLVRDHRFFPNTARPGLWLLINYKNLEFFTLLAKDQLCHTAVATLDKSPFNPLYDQAQVK
jgi:hypothetical protein